MLGFLGILGAFLLFPELYSREYRELKNYSDQQAEIFWPKFKAALSTEKDFHVKDITNFNWDTICILGAYANLREWMKIDYVYGRDFLELAHFTNNGEHQWAALYIKDNKVIAVLRSELPEPLYTYPICSNSKARFKTIPHEAQLPKNLGEFNLSSVIAKLEELPICTEKTCNYVFIGETHD
jgi:hypothetical protein